MNALAFTIRHRRRPTPMRELPDAVAHALDHANAGLRDLLSVHDFDSAMRHGDFGDAVSHLMDAGDRLQDLACEPRDGAS